MKGYAPTVFHSLSRVHVLDPFRFYVGCQLPNTTLIYPNVGLAVDNIRAPMHLQKIDSINYHEVLLFELYNRTTPSLLLGVPIFLWSMAAFLVEPALKCWVKSVLESITYL